ncbi:MAG: hypothetical protein G01um101420_512 [Parcubacteria group bacterium Gr01-1014_20]|nr:MAG: hypothetical protein G01um101420_512 [Parcubacteria group bacterium Gr01-1014_20]
MTRVHEGGRLFFLSLILVLISTVLQLNFDDVFNFRPDFVLVALIVSAFFLGFFELIFVVLLSALIINWQPILSYEILILVLWPILVYFLNRFFPGKAWFNSLIMIALGIFILYASVIFRNFLDSSRLIALDVSVCLVFGFLIFNLFEKLKTK